MKKLILLSLSCVSLVSCASDAKSAPRILRVPADYATVQQAVSAASSGDEVVIDEGVYHESITVETAGITIRGKSRNVVIIDGQDRLPNGFSVTRNDVVIENLTVHSFTQNGIVFNGIEAATNGAGVDSTVTYGAGEDVLSGYRVSYVTSYNNGLYGIYAFAARNGVIEHSYVSGHPDSGIYIGQCKPCKAVVRNVIAENNAIGYYGTNSSDVAVINSKFINNRLGIAPNSQKAENLAPQGETIVAGNFVSNNGNKEAPKIPLGSIGVGIAIGGGTKNLVIANRVTNNPSAGIYVLSLNDYLPTNNRIINNQLEGNGTDLVFAPKGISSSSGNCFEGNIYSSSLPAKINAVMPCPSGGSLTHFKNFSELSSDIGPDYRTIPAPGLQVEMPKSFLIKGVGVIPVVDPESIPMPSR